MFSNARLNRLFAADHRCFDLAIDHGVFHNAEFLAGIENLPGAVATAVQAGPDAIQLGVGQTRWLTGVAGKDKPALVLRGDVANVYGTYLPEQLFCLPLGNLVEQALRADAAAVVLNLFHAADKTELYRQCLAYIAAVKAECERYAMPLMIEPLVLEPGSHGDYESSGHAGRIATLVRQAVELGADLIKCDPPTEAGEFYRLVEAAGGRPVLARGGGRMAEEMVFERTLEFLRQGASGIVYGRNIIQHPKPRQMTQALMAVVHRGAGGGSGHRDPTRLTPCTLKKKVHSHGHSHGHAQATGSILWWSLVATATFVVVELVAGLKAGSLALLSDAGHNFTDALSLGLALAGFYLQSKPADETKTYGYHRAGVLSAFVNALTLVVLSVWILYEAVLRLRAPEPVNETIMIWVAGLGLVMNGWIMLALRAASRDDINVRSAFVHMLGDALGSIAIIAGAVAIRYTGWVQVDPILSILIALLIVWTAWDIIRESLNILLEGLPRGIRLTDVTKAMGSVEGVLGVHDLHIWSLGSSTHALSCHVLIEDVPPSCSDTILRRLNAVLDGRFGIAHTTVQFEHVSCAISENGCAIPVNVPHEHEHPHSRDH